MSGRIVVQQLNKSDGYRRAVSFSRQPQCAWLSPDRKVLKEGRNGAHSSISLCNLFGSTERCHANHNRSRQLPGCAVAHASFFLLSPRTQCSFYLINLNCISINLDVGMLAAKFRVDQMFGRRVKRIRISTVRTQQTRRSAVFTGNQCYQRYLQRHNME